ncbi:transporter substrate-binding domain-containing protein [Vibrio aestuarianus]|uniref:Transporter substrate-binding domain-containing protein n=1 Tax=Vibrio aestuarianus TaxID=28171 RepID=A0A9X4FJC8_9VIBR|nr:transporter substrate-binding domain-containing protein [Vibrio aestuarianus]MDE1356816.1 transporter substrate-binding domain-containing protein [Vibrio aestuarianus]NGZ16530.1 amino acid ABC transporter substrate-binding protein [Vibrio aestuarianus]NGZ92497.1 amino acid ABC transporter substrate-binding protein [Vibrio aestuarianus subsp. cardii]
MKFRILLILLVAFNVNAERQTVYLTSLEWPPYSGVSLIENVFSVAVARAAFDIMGYELEVDFNPWSRTVASVAKKDLYIGYFPEYFFETDSFVFSEPIGTGPLGFVEAIAKPILWQSLQDLTDYRLGVVQGYKNTAELDELIEKGEVDWEAEIDDRYNIYKVAKGRLDLAVIDVNVFEYLVATDARADILKSRVKMNERLLLDAELFVAFKNTEQGRRWRGVFNEGLKQVDIDAIAQRLNHK